jgi:two-component system, OmpR family, KDP operon response regulator KdpE
MANKPVILVVDDDQPILTLMKTILREFGFEARLASSGTAAVSAARAERPDLVLLDKNMPGMSMEEIITALRDVSEVPILILSGEPISPVEINQYGANGAVQKPFDVPQLVEQIRSFVGVARR